MKAKLLSILFVFTIIIANAQSLSYEDLVNLQKSSLEKAKGFFTYKGFSWYSSTKDKESAILHNGYSLTYDQNIWKYSTEEVQFDTKTGHSNCIGYFTTESNFSAIENQAKIYLTLGVPEVQDNMLQTYYFNTTIAFSFNIKKQNGLTYYDICVTNSADLDSITNKLCSNCKGTGQITEFKTCSYCLGNGKEICNGCEGKGKLLCRYCTEGYNNCNYCGGKGIYKCQKCGGQGTINCSKCGGQGKLNCNICGGQGIVHTCPTCNGAGKITKTTAGGFLAYTYTCTACNGSGRGNFTCTNCGGKGKLSCPTCSGLGKLDCENCLGKGTITCATCAGVGKILCSYCKGDYSTTCTKCSGTGHTDIICSYCNGTGLSSEKIIKVCPVCNGTKLKISSMK